MKRERRAALLVALLLAVACRRDPLDELPAGTLWAGDGRAARSLLVALERLDGSPVALAARDLDRRLATCDHFLAFCPAGTPCALASRISCRPEATDAALVARVDAARAGASWLFVRGDGHRRFAAWATSGADGELAVRATFTDEGGSPEPWEALLPARRAAAPPVLSDGHALVHLRLRSDRGLADLAAAGASGARDLYGLDGRLLATMALEGTSELAIYDPAPGALIPPMALALDVRQRAAAVRGLEELLAHTQRRWGATRTAWKLGPYEGACLADLNVLPGLAPCYVATDRALVLGWNQLSVAVALLHPPEPGADEGSTLVVSLDRFAGADARLRAAWRSEGASHLTYPWTRITASGRKEWGHYALELRLAPVPGATP